ncbi:MAG: FxsA family protein [Sandaracinaceae bacterium]|nr:MAG: FxsA family protein [Sandaracinaceae bacterium]
MGKLFLLFTLVPIAETYLLYLMGRYMGWLPTLLLVVFTGVLGAALAKREGLKVWRSWSEALAEARMPEEGILGGVLVLVGGVLLVTPGVLTDVTGMLLLVPPSRRFIAKHVRARLEERFQQGSHTVRYRVDLGGGRVVDRVETRRGPSSSSRDPNVIDVEGEVVEERRRNDPAGSLKP